MFRLLGVVIMAITVFVHGCGDILSPEDVTESAFITLRAQIEEYAEANHRLPDTLMDLPRVKVERTVIRDGWGNDVAYSYTSDGEVTLSSPGPRKLIGKRAPIIRHFRVEVVGPASQKDPKKEEQTNKGVRKNYGG